MKLMHAQRQRLHSLSHHTLWQEVPSYTKHSLTAQKSAGGTPDPFGNHVQSNYNYKKPFRFQYDVNLFDLKKIYFYIQGA